ncbi:hypothetical protein AAHA92_14228 [Salvia divinorum]|uniref:Uncharacterized protein n=1 Tax=Salvia divinorum TaxID=28513 RepID=A0ABD1HEN8_SALDI
MSCHPFEEVRNAYVADSLHYSRVYRSRRKSKSNSPVRSRAAKEIAALFLIDSFFDLCSSHAKNPLLFDSAERPLFLPDCFDAFEAQTDLYWSCVFWWISYKPVDKSIYVRNPTLRLLFFSDSIS